jgi:hypothetical protein
VTVCIAAIHSNNTVVAVTDKRISFSGMVSVEGEMSKWLPTHKWIGMIAGENISAAIPMMDEVMAGDTGELTVEQFSALCRDSYRRQQTIGIESSILSKYDMTLKDFKLQGSKVFTEKVYEHLVEGIEEYKLEAQFMFAGFDQICAPHIFTLTDPGKTQFFDRTGYWAVGSGKHAAISHLSSYPYRRSESIGTCIYKAVAAKFAAESATDVGRDTEVSVKIRNIPPTMELPKDLVEYIRTVYDRIERVPRDAVETINLEMQRFEMNREENVKTHPLLVVTYDGMLDDVQAKAFRAALTAKNEAEKLPKKSSVHRPSRSKPVVS